MDPAVARLLAESTLSDPRGIEQLTVEEARRRGGSALVNANVPFEEVAEVRDIDVDGLHARLYRPRSGTLPLLVYFHGGGWVVGSVDISDPWCRRLANRSGCAILSVDYRLAPEHRYPAAADDAYRSVTWAYAHGGRLGAGQLAVGGSSAGGNIAAVAALRARDQGGPPLAAQLLHVPVTDHDMNTASYRRFATGYGLTRAGMTWYWGHYAPDPIRRGEPDASPLRARDLSGLAPAVVVTAECDPLRDEGRAYAERLRAANVPTRSLEYPGMVHGFMGWASAVPTARRAFDEIGAELRALLT